MSYDVLFSVIVSDYTIPSSRLSDQLFTMEHVPSVVSLNLGLGVIALHYQKMTLFSHMCGEMRKYFSVRYSLSLFFRLVIQLVQPRISIITLSGNIMIQYT